MTGGHVGCTAPPPCIHGVRVGDTGTYTIHKPQYTLIRGGGRATFSTHKLGDWRKLAA